MPASAKSERPFSRGQRRPQPCCVALPKWRHDGGSHSTGSGDSPFKTAVDHIGRALPHRVALRSQVPAASGNSIPFSRACHALRPSSSITVTA